MLLARSFRLELITVAERDPDSVTLMNGNVADESDATAISTGIHSRLPGTERDSPSVERHAVRRTSHTSIDVFSARRTPRDAENRRSIDRRVDSDRTIELVCGGS